MPLIRLNLRQWVGAAVVVGLLLSLPAGTLPPRRPGPNVSDVVLSGRMRVGVDPSYPPFASVDDTGQRVVGFDLDLANRIAERLGVAVEFEYVDVGAIFDGLLVKRYDAVISAIPPYPELTRQVAYSRHYFNAGQVLVRRLDDATAPRGISLKGQTVGVELGSAGEEEALRLAKGSAGVRVRSFDSRERAIAALEVGDVSVVVLDYLSAVEQTRNKPALTINPEFLTFEPYVIAVRKKDSLFLAEVNASLIALEQDGVLQNLRERWVH